MSDTIKTSTPPKPEGKDLGAMKFFLILILVGSTVAALTSLLQGTSIITWYPDIPSWVFFIVGILGLANVVFIIFLFRWKKWAFFGLFGTAAIAFILGLMTDQGITRSIASFLPVVGLYFAYYRAKWSLLE